MKITENIEVCDCVHTHKNIKKRAISDDNTLYALADLFKVFGDPTRIRILYALSAQELCVCDIASVLDMTQSAISHQLRILKQMKLVKFRREGKTVYYSLADSHVETILNQGLDHVLE
ncbi:MAG: ArsR/SmtB family transcription factor [Blautia sp.]|nr:metalloregulator ArsR/SmtB family transcription factor [Blautia sp.]MDD7370851.1 metalloregulator ArsR/SmtB family transcription factor [Bacillota bacterium]MDY3715627.1 metalloregulator ArsR/SmtB family transcription factor [Blautia sp.]